MAENQSETASREIDKETVKNRDPEAFVTNSPLVDLLTPGSKVRIMLALIRVRGEKLNPSAICERAAITHGTWYEHRDDLINLYGVIEEIENTSDSPVYRVNMDDPIVKRLDEILGLAAKRRNHTTDPDRQ